MYQALYRKWRPRTFDDVVGQEHITSTLKRQIETNRLSHAYLFVGTRGTGKTTCAKILAKAVNCEHPVNGSPCNECATCRGIDSGRILDVEELDAASNNGVDSVRMLREEAVFTPAAAKRRVYIVDEVHMLSTAAFNALLKILEEPPEHLLFILATTELRKVPATILSRCQRFSFRRLDREQIAARLLDVAGREQLPLTQDGAALLARLADGAMRDALSLLDQCSSAERIDTRAILELVGLSGSEQTLRLLEAVNRGDSAGALEILDALHGEGKDMAALMDELMMLARDILITKTAGKQAERLYSGMFDGETLSHLAKTVTTARLLAVLELLEQALRDMSRTSNRRLAAELCVIRLCDETLSGDMASVLSRLSALEEAVREGGAPAKRADSVPAPKKPAPRKEQAPPAPAEDTPPWEEPPAPPEEEKAPLRAEAPIPEPVRPAPGPDPAPPVLNGGGEPWQAILSRARQTMEISDYAVLSDENRCRGRVEGGVLTLVCATPFDALLLDTPQLQKQLRQAAKDALGRDVHLRVTDEASIASAPSRAASDKLDALGKFGVVFE